MTINTPNKKKTKRKHQTKKKLSRDVQGWKLTNIFRIHVYALPCSCDGHLSKRWHSHKRCQIQLGFCVRHSIFASSSNIHHLPMLDKKGYPNFWGAITASGKKWAFCCSTWLAEVDMDPPFQRFTISHHFQDSSPQRISNHFLVIWSAKRPLTLNPNDWRFNISSAHGLKWFETTIFWYKHV